MNKIKQDWLRLVFCFFLYQGKKKVSVAAVEATGDELYHHNHF
jgi:hypothetical protein